MSLTIAQLQLANDARNREWDPEGKIQIEFRAAELGGEAGEACNIMKKLARERMGIRGSRSSPEQLMEELADVVICCALSANHVGGDLGKAIVDKFNKTSTAYGLSIKL